MIWKYIKAAQFFPKYCPEIRCWKHKVTGRNGRNNPVKFSTQELRMIRTGIKRLMIDISLNIEVSKIGK